MSDQFPESLGGHKRGEPCSHPWLRVVCGECGDPVELRGPEPSAAPAQGELPVVPPGAEDTRGVFIVARGHPELVEQLRAVMGQSAGIQIIEDRRHAPRGAMRPEEVAAAVRTQFRKRVLEEGPGEPPDSG